MVGVPRRLAAKARAGASAAGSSGKEWSPELPAPLAALLLAPAAFLLLALFVLPLVRVVQLSFTDPSFGVGRYADFFHSRASVEALWTTLGVSAVVTVFAVGIGAVVAWTLRSTRSRVLRVMLWIATIFPLWMSVVVLTYVFTVLLQRYGIVNESLRAIGLTDEPLQLLYNTQAVIVAMVYSLTPLATLSLYATFINIDEDLVRAAETLGARRIRAILTIVVPLSLTAFLAAATVVFVIALGFYITPTFLGTPTRPFLSAIIADQVYNQYDVAAASAGSSILLAIAVVTVITMGVVVGRERLRRAVA